MKELIRRILFPFMPATIRAQSGTVLFRFLSWLYEDEVEPEFPCVYPEDYNDTDAQ